MTATLALLSDFAGYLTFAAVAALTVPAIVLAAAVSRDR